MLPFGDHQHWDQLLQQLAALVQAGRQDEFLLLLPTGRLLHSSRQRLIVRATRQLNLFTFDDIVEKTLARENLLAVTGIARRQLIKYAFAKAAADGKLNKLSPHAKSWGVAASLEHALVELRRRKVSPPARCTELTRDVLIVAEYYCRLLAEKNGADIEERYARATDLLPGAKWLRPVQQVHVAWFFDFEQIQLDLLAALADRVKATTVYLPYFHRQPYMLVERTAVQLRQLGFEIQVGEQESGKMSSALGNIVRNLYVADAAPAPSPGIKALAATRLEQEVELAAVEIKRLAREKAAPADICLMVADQRRYLPAIRRVFREAAIDISMPWVVDLATVPWLRELFSIWQAAANPDCSFLASLAASGYFTAHLPPEADGDAMVVALAQLGGNCSGSSILKQVDAESTRLESLLDGAENWRLKEEERLLAVYRLARPAIKGWLDGLEKWFPGKLTLSQHCQLVVKLMEDNHHRICTQAEDEAALRDKLAWEVLTRVLEQFQTCHHMLGTDGQVMNPAEFLAAILPWLEQSMPLERANPGAVQVLSPSQSRGLQFRHVIVLGLNQGVFPRADTAPWLLGRIEEDFGLADVTADMVVERQHIFFHCCIAMAEETLILCRQLPGETEGEISTFWRDVSALVEGGIPEKVRESNELLAPLAETEICSLRRLTERVVFDRARHCKSPLLKKAAGLIGRGPGIEALVAGINCQRRRYSSQLLGNEDGILAASPSLEELMRRNARGVYSISRLEQYAACPFKYFAAVVLKLEPLELEREEFDPLERGGFLHWLLEQFYRYHLRDVCSDRPETIRDPLALLARKWLDKKGKTLSPAWRLRISDAIEMVTELIQRDLLWQRSTGLQPLLLEAEFGRPESAIGPIPVADSKVRFQGYIDRIDIMSYGGENWGVVYDYKSSRGETWRRIRQGLSLQIPVYIAAATRLLEHAGYSPVKIMGGGYYSIKEAKLSGGVWHKEFAQYGKIRNTSLPEEQWQALFSAIAKAADSYHAGILRGRFPPRPSDGACRYCQFSACCRYDQNRLRRKEGGGSSGTDR